TGRPSCAAPERDSRCTAVKPYRCKASRSQRRRRDETNEETNPYRGRRCVCGGIATGRECPIRFWHRVRPDTVGPCRYANRTRRTIHRQPIPADSARPTDFHEYREDRYYGPTSLQRCKTAVRAHASDDSRSTDALCAISVSDF